jgi:hypothetical protein
MSYILLFQFSILQATREWGEEVMCAKRYFGKQQNQAQQLGKRNSRDIKSDVQE